MNITGNELHSPSLLMMMSCIVSNFIMTGLKMFFNQTRPFREILFRWSLNIWVASEEAKRRIDQGSAGSGLTNDEVEAWK